MTTREKIEACIKRNPNWTDIRIANSTGARQYEIQAFRAGGPAPVQNVTTVSDSVIKAPVVETGQRAGFVSLSDIERRYDIRAAIYREIQNIPAGKLINESDFAQAAAGTDRPRFRRALELNPEEFRPYRIKLRLDDSSDGRWFWGRAEDIAKAVKIRDL